MWVDVYIQYQTTLRHGGRLKALRCMEYHIYPYGLEISINSSCRIPIVVNLVANSISKKIIYIHPIELELSAATDTAMTVQHFDNKYVPFFVDAIPAFSWSWLVSGFANWVTGRVTLVEQDLLTLLEYMSLQQDLLTILEYMSLQQDLLTLLEHMTSPWWH
jgi:hypothetical protein